ncbi:MAG: HAD family hydrolase [Tannerella sp.]|jgi:putative hydrolase of the HAD superfamily|nr:HAD family hydrolase [Tannerella sp.]
MDIRINSRSFFIFDLDDTLYPEADFLKSGYREVANYLQPVIRKDLYDQMIDWYKNGIHAFSSVVEEYGDATITVDKLLSVYRLHFPDIRLRRDASVFIRRLQEYNVPMGLITDGRSITQRNKLKALKIEDCFKDIIISEEFGSEKPDEKNYNFFPDKYPDTHFFFFGDNLNKDFIIPVKSGWTSFCLIDNGGNIHKQRNIHDHKHIYFIDSYDEINLIYEL